MSLSKEKAAGPMGVGPGWVTFAAFKPDFSRVVNGILHHGDIGTGKDDHSQTIWAKVYSCGSMANRASIEPFSPEVERRQGFPLPHGTWICCRKANHHTFKMEFQAVQTTDIVAWWPADRSWKSIVDEIYNAKLTLFGEQQGNSQE